MSKYYKILHNFLPPLDVGAIASTRKIFKIHTIFIIQKRFENSVTLDLSTSAGKWSSKVLLPSCFDIGGGGKSTIGVTN